VDSSADPPLAPARPLLAALGAVVLGIVCSRPQLAGVLPFAVGVWALVAAGRLDRRATAALVLLALGACASAHRTPATGAPAAWRGTGGGTEWIGRIAGDLHRLPAHSVVEGEAVRVIGTGRTRRPATGTVQAASNGAALRVLQSDELARLAPPSRGLLRALEDPLRDWRRNGLDRLARWRDRDARAAAAALCFGDKSRLESTTTDLFARTGTRHLLAVSGLHVVLLAGALVLPFAMVCAALGRRLPPRIARWTGQPAAWRVVGLIALVPLAGSGAPVMRAALVLALAQLAPLLPGSRRPDGLSLWAGAALFELAADPFAFSGLGHQLSYCAALGLILGHRGASNLLARLFERRAVPRGPRAERRRAFVNPFLRALRATLAAALAAGIATLPLIWWSIGEVCPWDPLTTAAALPPLTVFLCSAWAWICLPLPIFEWSAELAYAALTGVLLWADRLPLTPLPLPQRPLWLLALGSGCTVLALRRRGTGRGLVPARVAAGVWACALMPWAVAPEGWRFDALDVGHGTSVLVRGPDGAVLVFDAGSRDRSRVARGALSPSLRAFEVRRPTIVLSHDDQDHSGALDWILERHPPRAWWGALPARFAERLPEDCAHADVGTGRMQTTWSRGVRVTLARGSNVTGNEGSRVLALETDAWRVLLCGDAESDGLAELLSTGVLDGPWDLMLFPHHGSETPLLGPLLDTAQPREVWISASALTGVVHELDRREIPWRATCLEGPLHRICLE
jgi:competence protein ComEC